MIFSLLYMTKYKLYYSEFYKKVYRQIKIVENFRGWGSEKSDKTMQNIQNKT